jgi:hypothetical protein
MHISNRDTPAVAAATSSSNLRFGLLSSGADISGVVKGHLLRGNRQDLLTSTEEWE